jgi:hypothetical protein
MAKEQNLSLNPAKISGICGRLMCCLKYESGMYDDPRPRTAQRPAAAPDVIEAPVCPGGVQCIGCDELIAKEDVLPEDEEGLLVAVVDEIPGLEPSPDKVTDSPKIPEKMRPQAGITVAPAAVDRNGQVESPNTSAPRQDMPAHGPVRKEFVPRKNWNDQKRPAAFQGQGPQGNANPKPAAANKAGWQDFQPREKAEAPKQAENMKPAGIPSGNPQGPKPVDTRHFKNRRRSHGHRREDGPADPNGSPKGE